MVPDSQNAFITGFECVAAWSDLLDQINVFPVADGDTGRNLTISLTPLRDLKDGPENTIHKLMLHARGNSGNIAVRFFVGFLKAVFDGSILKGARAGRDLAWQAVYNPLPGTMLTIFDALVDFLDTKSFENTPKYVAGLVNHLEKAVKSTPDLLPRLKSAGVVDAGALGMYIFWDAFFKRLAGSTDISQPITEIFEGSLNVSASFRENMQKGHCIDTVMRVTDGGEEKIRNLIEHGDSVVVIPHEDYLKVHLHTDDAKKVKNRLKSLGDIVRWSDDNIGTQVRDFKKVQPRGAVHIMTDAAGSVTRDDARRLGITLLDSYITAGNVPLPETHFSPSDLYRFMRNGVRVTTSQASVFERHQHYQSALQQYPRVLYLCVGSVFTGNCAVAVKWKEKNDPDDRLTVIDTEAASGRLGTIVIATARFSDKTSDPEAVVQFARSAIQMCEEYIFLDKLKYLADGGRLSR
ncbi:MAG: DegV family protein, partial [Desulfobacterales bacterium]|nr:DegV family protein [Desulfobacterales bacterium]